MNAIRQGERSRARDLLTRLIKLDRNQAHYWLWMSTVVETRRERIFCLKEVLRIDPLHDEARRGLIMMGALLPDDRLAIPLKYQKRSWKPQVQGEEPVKAFSKISRLQAAGIAAVALVVVVLIVLASRPEPAPVSTSLARLTSAYTATPEDTPTPLPSTQTLTPVGLVPLSQLLDRTFTPTPLYVNTPHPRSEAYRSGIFAYGRGEWATVLNYMQQVSTLEPTAPDIFYYIGEAHRFQQRYAQAVEAYSYAIEMSPIFAPSYMGRARASLAQYPARWLAASKDLETAIQYDPNLYEAYLELAKIDLEHRTPEDVLARLEPAARLAPDSPLVFHYRAAAYLLIDQPELALSDALRLQELDPTFLPGYRQVGQAYQRVGDTTKALEALEIYTRYEDDDAEAYFWLGLAYQSHGEVDRAIETLSRAIALNSRLVGAHYHRGLLYLQTGQGEKAVADLGEARRRSDRDYAINLALGKAYFLEKHFTTANQQFLMTESLASSPLEKAEVYYFRARTRIELNERVAAARDWNALLALEDEEIPAAWVEAASEWLSSYNTPTPTPITPTATLTRQPTNTLTATHTRQPTATASATHTRQPTITATPTRTPTSTTTPTRTPTNTATPTRTPTPTPK